VPDRGRRPAKLALLAFRDLKEAVALDADVPRRVGVERGSASRHQDPIRGPRMRR
jgi:hypothetical protein